MSGAVASMWATAAGAQTVPINTDFSLTSTLTPGSGLSFTLGGPGIYLPSVVKLPAGGLTINGADNTLTLNNGTTYGYFSGSALTLQNITVSGGGPGGEGSVISGTPGVALTTVGNVSLSNNGPATVAGAIGASDVGITILGDAGGSITLSGNTGLSGAVNVGATNGNGVTVTGGTITLNGNTATSSPGGAIFAPGPISVSAATGGVSLDGNSAISSGGAIQAAANGASTPYIVGITAGSTAGSKVDLSNNSLSIPVGGTGSQLNGGGSAIFATGTITVTGELTANTNPIAVAAGATLTGVGGAVYSWGDVSAINGSVTAQGNTGAQFGGAFAAMGATAGSNGDVDLATSSGDVSLTGNTVSGSFNFGPLFFGPTVSFPLAGGAIFAGNDVNIGNANSTVTITDNQTGAGWGGAIVSGGKVTIQSGGTSVVSGNSAVGAGSEGGAIWVLGDLDLTTTGGSLTFGGAGVGNTANGQANAIWLDNYESPPQTATLDAAAGSRIVFYDPIQNNATHGVLNVNVSNTGIVAFDGSQWPGAANQWSQIYGATQVQGGIFAVENKAVYGVVAADVGGTGGSSFVLSANATLAGGGATTQIGTVRADAITLDGGSTFDISGSHSIGNPAGTATGGGFSTFNLTATKGTSAGSVTVGGTIEFNTCLNDANSQLSDVLDITTGGGATTGTIAGSATLVVSNVGCPGGLTTGNGILLVYADSANTDTFALSGTVSVGGYVYKLVQVGNNWYLQSSPPPQSDPGSTAAPIPALSRWALVLLALALTAMAVGRRRAR